MRELFARAGIYAATSCYEPFGLAPLEAALSRCAIVANDIASFREIWGDAAIYFRRNDARALREAIGRLQGDGNLRQQYADRAHAHARLHLTADQMVNRYVELYRGLTAKPAAMAAGDARAS